jgi:hypothetical protein
MRSKKERRKKNVFHVYFLVYFKAHSIVHIMVAVPKIK